MVSSVLCAILVVPSGFEGQWEEKKNLCSVTTLPDPWSHDYVTSAHCHRGKGANLEANGVLTSERYETFGGAPLRSK